MAKAEVVAERTLADAEAELAAARLEIGDLDAAIADLEVLAIDPEYKGLLVTILRDAVAGPSVGCPVQVAALNEYISRWSD